MHPYFWLIQLADNFISFKSTYISPLTTYFVRSPRMTALHSCHLIKVRWYVSITVVCPSISNVGHYYTHNDKSRFDIFMNVLSWILYMSSSTPWYIHNQVWIGFHFENEYINNSSVYWLKLSEIPSCLPKQTLFSMPAPEQLPQANRP